VARPVTSGSNRARDGGCGEEESNIREDEVLTLGASARTDIATRIVSLGWRERETYSLLELLLVLT